MKDKMVEGLAFTHPSVVRHLSYKLGKDTQEIVTLIKTVGEGVFDAMYHSHKKYKDWLMFIENDDEVYDMCLLLERRKISNTLSLDEAKRQLIKERYTTLNKLNIYKVMELFFDQDADRFQKIRGYYGL